jgi:DnaD/phage-associated family protein
LEQIDDMAELKCTLRLIWLLHQKRGYPRYVALSELLADRVLVGALAAAGKDPLSEIDQALGQAVSRGTLVRGDGDRNGAGGPIYTLNSESGRKVLAKLSQSGPPLDNTFEPEPWEGNVERPNIFRLYEDNIGMLSPMIAEQLTEAEEVYPPMWVEDAFREAVKSNKRSWRYVAAILDRWEREGRSDGRPVGSPKKAGYEEFLGR